MSSQVPKILFISLGSLALLMSLAYLALGHTTPELERPTAAVAELPQSAALRVETVHPQSLKDALELKLEGHVIAQRKQTISAQTEGRIAQVQTRVGDTVLAGQVLLQLDNPDKRIDLESLVQQQSLNTAILVNLNQKTKDYQEMLKLGLVARHDTQIAENDLRTKQIEQQGLAQQISHLKQSQTHMTVKSPQSGYLTDILSEGSYVTLGQTVATLVSSQDQYIEVYVPSEQLAEIKSGTPASFIWKKTSQNARVVRITPESQAGLVKLLLQADTLLPLDFRPQLSLKLKNVSGWVLPKRALVLAEGVPVFYQLRAHKAYPFKAQIIRDLDGQVLVSNPLHISDKIISSQADLLHEGMDVQHE